MFYTCFTLVQVKTTIIKIKLQIVQFQFSTAHFPWQSDQEFPRVRRGDDTLKPYSQKNVSDNITSLPENN